MYCFQVRHSASSNVTHPEMKLATSEEEDMELRSSSHLTQPQLNEQAERERARNSVRLIQESILCPSDSDSDHYRAASPHDYALALDLTAAKMVVAAAEQCKLFQSASSLLKPESQELLSTLQGLAAALHAVAGTPSLTHLQHVVEDALLCSTKAFTFLELLCHSAHSHKNVARMNALTRRLLNQTISLCEKITFQNTETENTARLSFGVTTYTIALPLKKKRHVVIPLVDLEGASSYSVEFSSETHSRWRFSSNGLTLSARIESFDRGFSQILHADRVKVEKGSIGWKEAQETVLLTYDDLVVANVASVTGSLLKESKHGSKCRASVQIVGSSRIDLDLQNLFVKGVKERDRVYYKCFVNVTGRKEVLAVYRFQRKQSCKCEGVLYVLGRGNQLGLRHVLVSIVASLGFT